MKPKVFVASSSERLKYAYSIQESLEKEAYVTVWSQGFFRLSSYTLDDLTERLDSFDFGIFIFAPDDLAEIRGEEYAAVRDNVVLELGLFIGKLGRRRTFIIGPSGREDLRLPTDLLGLSTASYDGSRPEGELQATLGPVANKISRSMGEVGVRPDRDSTETPGLSNASREWLGEHFQSVQKRILQDAKALAQSDGREEILPTDVATAAGRYAPGHPFPEFTSIWHRFASSISGITVVSAVLAVVFGLLGAMFTYKSNGYSDGGYFDIVKLFAGAVVGSTGAGLARTKSA